MKNLNLLFSFLLTVILSCSHPANKKETVSTDSTAITQKTEEHSERTTPKQDKVGDYGVKFGYLKYDEDKYGFSNPGFLNVFKNENLIYTDSFKGEGDVILESLGYLDLDGKKLVFRLNYGTEACDYAYTSKYYFADKDKISFLKECYSITGGDQYSSKFYEHILPTDSAGQPNSILIVEGQIFHEKDQPNQFDTTYIKFSGRQFTVLKPTDNLSKVK